MKFSMAIGILGLLALATSSIASDQSNRLQLKFDRERTGAIPAGAETFSGKWAIRAEADAPSRPNVLCQTGIADYPAIALTTRDYRDASVAVRFKPILGKGGSGSRHNLPHPGQGQLLYREG